MMSKTYSFANLLIQLVIHTHDKMLDLCYNKVPDFVGNLAKVMKTFDIPPHTDLQQFKL